MNSDMVISWLVHSDWILLALWIVLLATAVAGAFPERSFARDTARRSKGIPPLR
jgi:hypothetical protein